MKKINITHLIIIVFIISWIGIIPSLLISYEYDIPSGLRNLEILMTLGPLIGALIFLFSKSGISGITRFFKRLLLFKVDRVTLFAAIGIPILLSFLAAYIGNMMHVDGWPSGYSFSSILTNGAMITVMYLFLNTEELVWRGIVFDRLAKQYGFAKSCLILAPIWWLFHIPLFLFAEGHQAGYGIVEFTGIVLGQTFILGWIYLKSNRSLFYVHIHHQLINGFGQAFPIFPIFIGGFNLPIWILTVLILITAFMLWLKDRNAGQAYLPNNL